MKMKTSFQRAAINKYAACLAGASVLSAVLLLGPIPTHEHQPTHSVIVQGQNLAAVKAAVQTIGGSISHELGVIHGVAVELTGTQRASLKTTPGITRIFGNAAVETSARPINKSSYLTTSTDSLALSSTVEQVADETSHSTLVDADLLHAKGITGQGVTIAVLDTGLFIQNSLTKNTKNQPRILAQYDALADQELDTFDKSDSNGHGAHVTGISVNSQKSRSNKKYRGLAPNASLVVVRGLDANGQGSYADIIRGIDWIVSNKDSYDIRVLNLSLSAPPQVSLLG